MSPARESRRRTTAGIGEELTKLLLLLGVIAVGVVLWGALCLGSALAGLPIRWNPTAALLEVAFGNRTWPWQSTVIAGASAMAATAAAARWLLRRRDGRLEIDSAARTMQRPRQLSVGTVGANAEAAQRLLKDAPEQVRALAGPPLGFTVAGDLALHVPAELCVFIEAGARTGKTMAWAIPAMMAAWGPVLATSNRPDLYRHTVLGRRQRGREWLLDPQGVTGTAQVGFWVDLLRQVSTLAAARKLASFFVSASKDKDARVDSYFDGGAQDLLACYLLAAACAGGDLLHVAEWLGRDQDTTPALILRKHGKLRPAQRVLEYQALYSRQRDGLFDMARRFLNVLSDEIYARMVCPPLRRTITAHERGDNDIEVEVELDYDGPCHDLPEFDPRAFVTSNDTLYALSIEGPDSAAPLTAALVGQLLESAFAAARARPDGRLAVPLLAVLDEAANCCPISLLPSYYTYAGGHGVILMTFLQVLEQGKDLWGENGLKTMRAQAIEVYGGGISDTEFLQQLSTISDEHDVADRSHSVGPGGSNRTLTWRAETILNVAALAALPKQRALVRLPGHRPILVRKPWWQQGEYAALITESLSLFDETTETAKRPVILEPQPHSEDEL
ncbi:TraM recognition domain-containing protein [Nocardia amamiensis]|uniref:TraM recognition domain-containing protein n=1 Tax=Nocardia amamiensis TaxID=404578 RepID=A0ABS0D302_9NOCA|nr:TraM recognition domain-containing protein [Nocardia amamiensis]MBF6302780.1 TraM recognition domain-containing protein [Nocardia amamiensis]